MKKTLICTALLLALSGILMSFGVRRGEAETVYEKSTSICLECIGIG
ncbi:MAG: hypothetical protein IJS44_01360 [Clostridia bacterium]|nr:hypothetical protein [Clostridia bacterium]